MQKTWPTTISKADSARATLSCAIFLVRHSAKEEVSLIILIPLYLKNGFRAGRERMNVAVRREREDNLP